MRTPLVGGDGKVTRDRRCISFVENQRNCAQIPATESQVRPLVSSSVKAEPATAAAGMRGFSTRAGQSLFDINDKFATITPKGEQNEGRFTTVSQSGNGEWDGVLPAIQEEHERRVGTYRSIISGNKQAPVRLRGAIKGVTIHEAQIKPSPTQDASIKTLRAIVSEDLGRPLPADVFTKVMLDSPVANIGKIARAFGKEKGAIITPKGEQNGPESTADTQSGNAGRDSVLPEVREGHRREVDSARQRILATDDSPPRLKAATKAGQGLIHYPEGYNSPDYKEAQSIASAFGVEVIPVTDTSGTINAFIYDVGSALIRDPITLEIKKCFGKGRSPFIPRREPLARSQAEAKAALAECAVLFRSASRALLKAPGGKQ